MTTETLHPPAIFAPVRETASILGGTAVFHRGAAPLALRVFRSITRHAPEGLLAHAMLSTVPDIGPALLVRMVYSGDDLREGERLLAPLRRFGPPQVDTFAERSYAEIHTLLMPSIPPGAATYHTTCTLRRPGDMALNTLVDAANQMPPHSLINLYPVYSAASSGAAHYAIVNLGVWMPGESSGKLYYGWCTVQCSGDDAPFTIVPVASGEGLNVDLGIDSRGRAHMVYDAGQRGILAHLSCAGNCGDSAAWQRRVLETSEQLNTQFAPASPFTCSQIQRAWLDGIPSLAFGPSDEIVVAYDAKNVAVCYYQDPTDPTKPPSTRVDRIWWAVRWASFSN